MFVASLQFRPDKCEAVTSSMLQSSSCHWLVLLVEAYLDTGALQLVL